MKRKKIIIIGAGFGGLSAAALLAQSGHEVTVFEKNSQPGGRAMVYRDKGFTFDMGPSWYLMPDVFERFFARFHKTPQNFLNLVRLDPAYRIFFSPKKIIDISSDLEKNITLFKKLEPDGEEKFKRYLDLSEEQYNISMTKFVYKEFRSIFDFFEKEVLFAGPKLKVWESIDRYTKRFFSSEDARKILQYNIVFLGGSPSNTPALYAIMAHIDFNLGVWYPMGGMGKLVEALVTLGKSHGVKYVFNQPVERIVVKEKHATGVKTTKGNYQADIVIANADYPYVETCLLPKESVSYPESYWRKKTVAPTGFIMYIGVKRKIKGLTHHNLFLEHDWMDHFNSIFSNPSWPDKPSYYVSCPSKTDPSVAPSGMENLFILVPVASGLADTPEIRQKYAEKILAHFQKSIGDQFEKEIITKRIFAHNDFSDLFHAYKGSALGLSHTLWQSALFRPAIRSKKVKNLFFAGQYTHPGIGVPTSIISGQIVSDAIEKES